MQRRLWSRSRGTKSYLRVRWDRAQPGQALTGAALSVGFQVHPEIAFLSPIFAPEPQSAPHEASVPQTKMDAASPHYTVLARRFRPQTFSEVVGQAHVAQALRNAIAAGRVAIEVDLS